MIFPMLLKQTTLLETTQSSSSSLYIATAAYFWMKLMEYSVRAVSNELCYSELDYECRYVGKEWIGLFANRL
eukprot:CAMPEP_0194055244 /NCGR_PEP_ID=MMETSP0009_2-20130614/56068_1 /TAXON_ID=210454 /ORGANISM="Grammatophora oceanica, Strain CCMP 410" /LENGTH=71 /DNA_ID=CAMNT_0038704077 /DNA_START=1 /DNA_END=213 /DNA_ORIENTATION=+